MMGSNFQLLMGGKGANQAVMTSAMVDEVVFLGAIGNDSFGTSAIENLMRKGVGIESISTKNNSTGLAIIQLVNGENSIAVIPGANLDIQKVEIDCFLDLHPDLSLIVSQLEINLEAITHLIEQCDNRNIPIILNPAPAQHLSSDLIDKVDYLIPNENEAEFLFNTQDYEKLVTDFAGKLLITMGSKGVMYYDQGNSFISPSQKIDVVDTTGAGDSFIAGFAVGISRKLGIKAAVELGIEIASETCLCMGAQGAYERVKQEHHEKIRNSK
ncbi:MAG: ribokinase [Erysipelotrichaceae bacterium]|nr:MAG: ribokinase [Erysipelotrichaceae bacterium]